MGARPSTSRRLLDRHDRHRHRCVRFLAGRGCHAALQVLLADRRPLPAARPGPSPRPRHDSTSFTSSVGAAPGFEGFLLIVYGGTGTQVLGFSEWQPIVRPV